MPDIDARDRLEEDLGRVLTRAFASARRRLVDELWRQGLTTNDLSTLDPAVLSDIRTTLIAEMQPVLMSAYEEAVRSFAEAVSYGVDEAIIIARAENWSNTYTPQLVDGLLNTSRQRLADMASQGANVPLSRQGLVGLLGTIFSLSRVTTIARTEITNAISAGETLVQQELQGQGAMVEEVWFTQLDERVCPICAPRHGKVKGDGWQNDPPAHPRCRCYKGYRITANDGQRVILFDDDAVARELRR